MTEPSAGELLSIVRKLALELHPERDRIEVELGSALDRDLGIDSLGRVELLTRVEQAFGACLPEDTFAVIETPRDLLEALARESAEPFPVEIPDEYLVAGERKGRVRLPDRAETLVEVLHWHARHHPDRVHIRFYTDRGDGEVITYGRLLAEALAVANGLQASGFAPGDRALIMLPTSREYFLSFFGILLAGGIPVPIYPPVRRGQLEDHLKRQSAVVRNCRPSALVTVPEARNLARFLKSRVETLRWIGTVEELQALDGRYANAWPGSTDTGFIQYTSGSTGNPKGVVLSHANLMANIRADGDAVRATDQDVFVSWLPLYHDMGLIGAWFGSMYFGVELVIMSPMVFLGRPVRWLRAIQRHGGTISAAPNFAYELCVTKIRDEDLAGLDLGSWRMAMNGAEAVSAATLEKFIARFAPYGFDPTALSPVYGLAECSVGLAFPPLGRGPLIDDIERDTFLDEGRAVPATESEEDPVRFVACGRPIPLHEVRVVDERDCELPDRQQGRVQFRGPSATQGYYRNEVATRQLIRGDWLDSGDLGYMDGEELYITGRRKDMIIRAGRNIFPEELEAAIGEIPKLRRGRVAVFGSIDPASGTERLVAIAETRVSDTEARRALRSRINEIITDLTDIPPDDIVLAPPGTVLKTSSGKLRRGDCRALYEKRAIGKEGKAAWLRFAGMALSGVQPALRRTWSLVKSYTYAGWCWLVFAFLALIAWTAVMILPKDAWRWVVIRRCARLLATATFTPIEVEGIEHIPRDEPCIIVANHQSYLDGYLMIAVLPIRFSFVAKAELQQKKTIRWFLERIGVIFVERFDSKAAISGANEAVVAARLGRSLLYFPEGTFTRMPGLLPFKMGAFATAIEARLAVVPVAIQGTREILRDGSWFPRHGFLKLWCTKPLAEERRPSETDAARWEHALDLRNRSRAEFARLVHSISL